MTAVVGIEIEDDEGVPAARDDAVLFITIRPLRSAETQPASFAVPESGCTRPPGMETFPVTPASGPVRLPPRPYAECSDDLPPRGVSS